MREFANSRKALHRWRNELLDYFDDPVTNGSAEGITNKIKVMKRSAYGFKQHDESEFLPFGNTPG